MEYIIKTRERIIAYLVISVYFGLTYFYIINKRTYSINEDLTALQRQFFLLLYGLVILIYLIFIIRGVLFKKRVDLKNVSVIYSPKIRAYYIRLVLLILMHLMYWALLSLGEYRAFLLILIGMSILLIPTPTFSSVFESEDYIIYMGNKYCFKDISNVRKNFGYRLKFDIKHKEKTIQVFNMKKYTILWEKFCEHRS